MGKKHLEKENKTKRSMAVRKVVRITTIEEKK